MSYTLESIERMLVRSVSDYKTTRQVVKYLRKFKPRSLDKFFHEQHEEEFAKIDCLECANCCKSISPAIYEADIKRMASCLKMKESTFLDKYLTGGGDNDYIFKETPCPFLDPDNYCSIYASRPRACRDYPHTDRKRMYQILDLTARNSTVCPAVHNIIEKLKNGTSRV